MGSDHLSLLRRAAERFGGIVKVAGRAVVNVLGAPFRLAYHGLDVLTGGRVEELRKKILPELVKTAWLALALTALGLPVVPWVAAALGKAGVAARTLIGGAFARPMFPALPARILGPVKWLGGRAGSWAGWYVGRVQALFP